MLRQLIGGVLVLFALCGAAAPREAKPVLLVMHGHCDSLRVGKRDATDECNGRVVGSLRGGHVLFVFGTTGDDGDDALVMFGGSGVQIRVGDKIVQPVDTMSFTYKKHTDPDANAVGVCEYTDFYKGVARVACTAVVDGGRRYEAGFTTDGAKPKRL